MTPPDATSHHDQLTTTDLVVHRACPPVVVLMCGDLDTASGGFDLRSAAQWLQTNLPDVRVRIIPDLCGHIEQIPRHHAAAGGGWLVMGLCARPQSRPLLQTALRRAGLDPLGVEIVDLGTWTAGYSRSDATERAQLLLAAAGAKARAFPGSRAQNLKPVLPAAVSRRSMFTLALLEYHTVPSIATEFCRAEHGCVLCIHACPEGALSALDGELRLDKSRCTGCGLCVTACPQDAVEFPGAAPAQIDAQIRTLVDPALGLIQPRSIVFTCAHASGRLQHLIERGATYPANWLPVEVPCVEMVTSAWMLSCLARGAAAVAIMPCLDAAGPPGRVEGRVDFCGRMLEALGETEDRIFLLPTSDESLLSVLHRPLPTPRVQFGDLPVSFPSGSSARVVQAVAAGYKAATLAVAHPYSPFAIVHVVDGCTACGACADACPTGALRLQHGAEAALTFDAARCVGCGLCLPVCPEPGVLRLRQATDLRSLAAGAVTLRRTSYQRCRVCGQPVAPEAMLQRIVALLGGENAPIAGVIEGLCLDCRSHQVVT